MYFWSSLCYLVTLAPFLFLLALANFGFKFILVGIGVLIQGI